jgi:hypothetical protein
MREILLPEAPRFSRTLLHGLLSMLKEAEEEWKNSSIIPYWLTKGDNLTTFLYLYLRQVIYTMTCAYVFCVLECGLFNCTFLNAWLWFQQRLLLIIITQHSACNSIFSAPRSHFSLLNTKPLPSLNILCVRDNISADSNLWNNRLS